METQYYPINENAARLSKHMSSFDDYREGSATAVYRSQVDKAAELATQQAERKPDFADEIECLLDRYARKLAEYYNRENEIGTRCASVMIAGPSNFPVRKKEKQVAAWDRNRETYADAERLLARMRSIGTGGIKSSDARAVEKLQAKIEDAESAQQTMKDVNAYYRKHGTLDDCPYIAEDIARKLSASMESSYHPKGAPPYESWALSNNNANIHRMKERIAQLQREKERGAQAEPQTIADGVRVFENVALMRIQILFDDKPGAETRDILKGEGFRWSPSQSAWQRDLNENGRRAARRAMKKIAPDAETSEAPQGPAQARPLHEQPRAVYLYTEQGAKVKREHGQEVTAGDECETGLGQNALDKWERAGLVEEVPETVTLAEFAERVGE